MLIFSSQILVPHLYHNPRKSLKINLSHAWWHNRQVSERRRIRVDVIAILSQNYEILNSLLSDNRLAAELPELTKAGYDPAFVTGYRKRLSGPDEFLCFDICFRQSSTRIYNIRRKRLWPEGINTRSPGPSQGPISRP